MLKHRPIDRSHMNTTRCVLKLDAPETAQQGTESNGYRGTGPGERVRSVNERSSHHRVVSGQLHNAQKPVKRPLPHVNTTRCVLKLDAPDGSAGAPRVTDIVVTGPGERVGSVNERSSHHRVVSGQLHNAQTPANRPLTHAQYHQVRSQIGRTRRLSRAPRVTDIVARGQVSGSDR